MTTRTKKQTKNRIPKMPPAVDIFNTHVTRAGNVIVVPMVIPLEAEKILKKRK